jgi:DNA-binding NarL/FixJ family response regulator
MIKVAIIDDHPMVISGIQNMLRGQKNISVAATYGCGKELLEGLKKPRPDVLLLDINLPDKNGNELVPVILKSYPDLKILALTSMDTPFYVKDMMRHGCKGYLLKNTAQEELVNAIETVYKGEEYLEPGMKDQLVQSMLHANKQTGVSSLTRREKEILQLIAMEYSSPEIAEKLFLSLRTVENHRLSLMQKLNVKNMIGLAKVAMGMGLVE